ncbi:hypothetical protein K0T92_21285 [Paenibacillus oenotherae]|uniref:Uncharacterized protein n=1 Tax=Paenibacillus oenotherae TaxID=1435645 RepID=A0ABS7DBM5_9BACL|nr:hypothetical protein [Paenibacillus oenotherae]MBW7477255.1 hypothetical protein [Paenibacillus oenotherae]
MKYIDESKLTDHLDACIALAEGKEDWRIAEVLRNLHKEIKGGEFAAEHDERGRS